MKKRYLLFLGIVLTSLTTSSQVRESGTIELIPNIGYSGSFFNGEGNSGSDQRTDLQVGVIIEYYLNDRWSIKSGISYFGMGAPFFGSELKLDYLNIPLNINWHFGSSRNWNFNFGITPGFLTKVYYDGEDLEDLFKSSQITISYGIGYKIKVSNNFCLLIEGQGLLGVTSILEDDNDFQLLNAGASINLGGVFTF